MKSNDKKQKEQKKTKSDSSTVKVKSEYQQGKTRKSMIVPSSFREKKNE